MTPYDATHVVFNKTVITPSDVMTLNLNETMTNEDMI